MKIHINLPQTTDVNISKGQPSRANGLGGVVSLRSKSPTILYKYRKMGPNFEKGNLKYLPSILI